MSTRIASNDASPAAHVVGDAPHVAHVDQGDLDSAGSAPWRWHDDETPPDSYGRAVPDWQPTPAAPGDLMDAVGHWADGPAGADGADAVGPVTPSENQLAFGPSTRRSNAAPASAPKKKGPAQNAILKVGVLSKGQITQHWGTKAVWKGAMPCTFTAFRRGKRWVWDDEAGSKVRVETDELGRGGRRVESWAKGGDKIIVYVQAIDDVTINEDAEINSLAPGHAEHEEDAGDGSTNRKAPDGRGAGEGLGRSQGDKGDGDYTGTDGGERREPADNEKSTSEGSKQGSDGEIEPSAEDEEIADDLEIDLGLDPASGDAIGSSAGGKKPGGEGKAGGDVDGRTGEDTTIGGTGPGGEEAREGGDREGSQDGGEGGSRDGSLDGKDGGDPDGMYGGEGKPGDDGVPSAGGVIGLIGVPAALKGAVELAFIISDGNITGAGAGLFSRGVGKLTSAVAVRKVVARQARVSAAKETRAAIRHIATDKASAGSWKAATRVEKDAVKRRIYWEMQRRYFDGYQKAAKAAKRDARRAMRRSAKNLDAKQQFKTAEMAEEAATVKPVAGRLPQNHEYAGKAFPADQLPEAYRAKGVRFTAEGYPDFAPHAKQLPNGKNYVEIEFTGSRSRDFTAANAKAGLDRTPDGFTWHHVEDMKRMYLIPDDLHEAVKHTGGAAHYKHTTGALAYD